ncbi:hypothetical protein KFK09_007611 [Dendrobium nobile]|uniref:Myb/SANT-like DNA-binding domain-containing protein n=1 Tax=Dendrobium nobile TaxID=94219 RepID=A0A8T3BUL6_DENNO|nr:hypothetical protein KFK09_007611 [Dendrobium nobile]
MAFSSQLPSAAAAGESSPASLPSRPGFPPPCWSHDETLSLIESYRDKWHSLRCGNLRAADWGEVAADVSRRCSHLPFATPKTSVQCRHKVEKLRKRFRSERLRSSNLRRSSPWPFFHIMESLYHRPHSDSDSGTAGNTRSYHRRMPNGGQGLQFTIPKALRSKIVNPCSGGGRVSKSSMQEIRRRLEMTRNEERERKKEREGDAVGDMIAALRKLGDGYMRMERMKMDMARETERFRMEMELKRTEAMLDLHSQIVDAFAKRFAGSVNKKAKLSPSA